MARDEARFHEQERAPSEPATLCLYRWERPTLSFGYAQDPETEFDLEALGRAGVPWVRRPTGGRAILHADEWTYSVIGGLDDARLGGPLRRTYAAVTSVVRQALEDLGVQPDPPSSRPPRGRGGAARTACFASAWGHEITVRGRKLVGSAQRRGRNAFLQQGTILVGPGHEELAAFARATAAERRVLRESLLASTVTVSSLVEGTAEFARFAACLAAAWRAGPPAQAPPSLDREGVET